MNRVTLLFGLLFLLFGNNLSADDRGYLDGWFYHTNGRNRIEVNAKKHGIQVRGIRSSRDWQWFRKERHGTYVSECGSMQLRVRGEGRHTYIVIKDRYGADVYERPEYHKGACGTIIESRITYSDYDGTSHHGHRENDTNRHNSGNYDKGTMHVDEGRYRSDDGREVIIVRTRDGIRGRFSDDPVWRDYVAKGNTFYDVAGNYYEWHNNGQLTWVGNRSGKRIVINYIDNNW